MQNILSKNAYYLLLNYIIFVFVYSGSIKRIWFYNRQFSLKCVLFHEQRDKLIETLCTFVDVAH